MMEFYLCTVDGDRDSKSMIQFNPLLFRARKRCQIGLAANMPRSPQ
uniref:Uncharacterized protein n=1 Tax=Anguilla anguilla TaxID=7936 RepID=A0A0E9UBF5_ANGAN